MSPFWKDGRVAANLKQADAAELLFISPSNLSKLENGLRLPSAKLILRMSEVYRAPELISRYCREICPFHIDDGLQSEAETNPHTLTEAVGSSVENLQKIGNLLVDIMEDGRIDPQEQLQLHRMRPTLLEVSRKAKALKNWARRTGVALPDEVGAQATQPNTAGLRESLGDVYTRARKAAGYNNYQEAARQLHLDRDRLSDIENGEAIPKPDEVLSLAGQYQAPELIPFYCSYQCAIGRRHRPLSDRPEDISLAMISTLYHIERLHRELNRLMEDGKITPDEAAAFQALIARLNNLIFAVDSLLSWLDTHDTPVESG